MRAVTLIVCSLIFVTSQVHGSSSLSASEYEHSPEIAGLFDWLKDNGAKVCPIHQYLQCREHCKGCNLAALEPRVNLHMRALVTVLGFGTTCRSG